MLKMRLFAVICIIGFCYGFIKPVKTATESKTMAEQVKWNEIDHLFGKMTIGPDATFTFQFTNKGKKPVQVKSAQPGCSCTVSTFSNDPIAKNKTGKVVAKYSTQNRPGWFKKGITVTFEDGSTQQLTITGEVLLP